MEGVGSPPPVPHLPAHRPSLSLKFLDDSQNIWCNLPHLCEPVDHRPLLISSNRAVSRTKLLLTPQSWRCGAWRSERNMYVRDHRRFCNFRKMVGRASLSLRPLAAKNRKLLHPNGRTQKRLWLRHFGTPRHIRTVPDAYPTVTLPRSSIIPRSRVRSFPFSPSPSSSITALSCFATEGGLGDELIVEPENVTPYDNGSVEVICSKTLPRVHTSTLPFHSSVLCQTFAPANLTAAEFSNRCPCIASSGTPADLTTLLKAIYLPG